ncbi:MAG: GGDEF domain-containing protein [Rubrivivax sp.]|nr:GGDEF domain-containing protein [Pyrinomonadaceae bacterium]
MRLNDFLGLRSPLFIYTCGFLLVGLLGVVDFLNGPDISSLIFYVIPVFLAAWHAGRRAGLLMCAASGVSWLIVAYATTGDFSNPFIAYWNAAVRLGFMLVLVHLVASFKISLTQERELARTDYLTGAVNGRSFTELSEVEINRARRNEHPFSVAFMDIDDFKLVNDREGHSAGNRLLQLVSDTIRQNVRTVDTVARLGGDEFAVLMPETGDEAAQVVIRRVRCELLEVVRRKGWPVTFSVGVVTWDYPPASVDDVLRASDELMYTAKRLGKNTVRHINANKPATAA